MTKYFHKNSTYNEFSFAHKFLQTLSQAIHFLTFILSIVAFVPVLILSFRIRFNEYDLFVQNIGNQSFNAIRNIKYEHSFILPLCISLVFTVLTISLFGLCGTLFKKTNLLIAYVVIQAVLLILCTIGLLIVLSERKRIYESFGIDKIK